MCVSGIVRRRDGVDELLIGEVLRTGNMGDEPHEHSVVEYFGVKPRNAVRVPECFDVVVDDNTDTELINTGLATAPSLCGREGRTPIERRVLSPRQGTAFLVVPFQGIPGVAERGNVPIIEEVVMPSVLGLMERREARARQDLESWTEVLEQAQAEVDAARERVERARVGREELVSVPAEEGTVNTPFSVPASDGAAAAVGWSGSGRAMASGGRDASPASAGRPRPGGRDSLIVAAHHTIWAWWSGRRSWLRLRRCEREKPGSACAPPPTCEPVRQIRVVRQIGARPRSAPRGGRMPSPVPGPGRRVDPHQFSSRPGWSMKVPNSAGAALESWRSAGVTVTSRSRPSVAGTPVSPSRAETGRACSAGHPHG